MIRAWAGSALWATMFATTMAGCGRDSATPRVPRPYDPGPKPDEMPSLLNADLPFRYPAAMAGAPELRFVPAKVHGEAIPVSILFPVYFRHPEARPLPGDSAVRGASRSGES